MEFYLALLLTSSFSCAGLLAIWAATSRRHWFVRAAVSVGFLSLLLLIPAHEAFVTFLLQGSIIIAFQKAIAWRQKPDDDRSTVLRFALRDFLLATTTVAIAIPISVKLFTDDWIDWTNVLQLGIALSFCVIIAHWSVFSRAWGWKTRTLAGLFCLLALSAAFTWMKTPLLEYILYPDEWFSTGVHPWQMPIWLAVFCSVFLVVQFALTIVTKSQTNGWRLFAAALLLLTSSPSIYFYYRLMTPTPLPNLELPSPNGYDDLVAAGIEANTRLINFADETPLDQLRKGLSQYDVMFERAELGLSRTVKVPLNLDFGDVDVDNLQAVRSLCRGFCARGRVHAASGNFDETLDDYLAISKLASVSKNGGVLIHWLTAEGVDSVGDDRLYQILSNLSARQCCRAIDAFERIEFQTDSLQEILHRERIWCERAYGFYGHLSVILDDLAEEGNWTEDRIIDFLAPKRQAERQLLITALAIRAYEDTHGTLPKSLEELTPDFLEQVPRDPFGANGSALRFQSEGKKYQLYSVGQNRIDDDGSKPELDADGYTDYETGDLLLSEVFAPWEPAEENATEGANEYGYEAEGP